MLGTGSPRTTSTGNESSYTWEIDEITINLSEIVIDQGEFNLELSRIKTNGVGGLGIEQTAGALKMNLREREDVYVVYDKEICGIAEIDNTRIQNQINRLIMVPKFIVFPYAINDQHQVSVVINMEEKKLIVTDSLGVNRRNNNNIKDLARQLGIENIIDGVSNYNKQKNNWECGVHTFFNTLDVVNNKRIRGKETLELKNNIKVILEYSMRYRWVEEKLQAKREENRLEKTRLLEALESLRDNEGNFRSPNPEDDLKVLADVLQMELWGNLDRREPTSHSGRNLTQEERVRERKIEELIEQYEKECPEDVLGIIVLNVLKRGGEYEEVIKYHRNVITLGDMDYTDMKECKTEASKLNNLGRVFYVLGKYNKALEYYKKTISIWEGTYGNKHPDITTSYNGIGNVLFAQGKYEVALQYYNKVLNIRKIVYGIEHHKVADLYNNIGGILASQGNFSDALIYHNKALDIRQKVYGNEHRVVAQSYNNIGGVLTSQGKFNDALEYYDKALNIHEKVYGSEHPAVASSYNSIGKVFYEQGKHDLALNYYNKALDSKKKIYGKEHYFFVTSYEAIAGILYAKGRFDEALKICRKVLTIRKKVLGDDHPEVAKSYGNIGIILYAQCKYGLALDHYNQALVVYKKAFGNEHHKVADLYNNIGAVLEDQNQYNESLKYYNKALVIVKKIYGEEHCKTADLYSNIGVLLKAQANYNMALEYYNKALIIYEKVFGDEHHNVALFYKNIGDVLKEQSRYGEALSYYNKVLDIRKKVYGENHYKVAHSYTNIGMLLMEQNEYGEALEHINKAYIIMEKLYGINHDNTQRLLEMQSRLCRIGSNEGGRKETISNDQEVNTSSLAHKELMKKFQKELKVSWDDVYTGTAVEQAVLGMAGISTKQDGAQYRPSITNGVITTTFWLKFSSSNELGKFMSYYNQNFPGLLKNENLEYQSGQLSEIIMETRVLHNEVARSLGDYLLRTRAQEMHVPPTNLRTESSGCYLS